MKKQFHQKNPVAPPTLAASHRPSYVDKLFELPEKAHIIVYFDDPKEPRVERTFKRSSPLMELFFTAAKRKATVVLLQVGNKAVGPAEITRLNWFLCKPGFVAAGTFRTWRRNYIATEGGSLFWKTSGAFEEVLEMIGAKL